MAAPKKFKNGYSGFDMSQNEKSKQNLKSVFQAKFPVSDAACDHKRGLVVVVLNVEVQVLPLDVEDGLDHACLAVLAGYVQPSIS